MRYILAMVMMLAVPAYGQDREITLVSDPALEESGLWAYVLPRFKLKTGIKVHVFYGQTGGDILISGQGVPLLIRDDGVEFGLTVLEENIHSTKFTEWLTSDIGARTILAFQVEGRSPFTPAETTVEVVEVVLQGNNSAGEEVAYRKCGRCHVIGERNKYGGIDSTPSFGALRTFDDWQEKFGRFWELNPHPSFMQVEDMTEPFDPSRPPHIYPVTLTLDEVSDIGAYMQTVTPKDLGPKLEGE